METKKLDPLVVDVDRSSCRKGDLNPHEIAFTRT